VAAAAIAVLYLVTRLWFVGRFPYFSDEGQFATYTDQAAHSLHQLFVSESDGAPLPLFTWFGIPWVKLGFNPLVAVRLVSVTSGLLTVGVVGLLGRRLGGTAVGLVAAALCVLLPLFVVHDGIGIYEPLVTLEMAAALYAQIELARHPSLRRGAVLGLVLAAGTLTKQNTEPALVLVLVSLLCLDWSPVGRRRRLTKWITGVMIAAIMVLGAEVLLRSSHYWNQGLLLRKLGVWPSRTLGQVLSDPFNAVPRHAWSVFRPALLGYVTIPLIALGAVGAWLAWRARPRLTAVLLAWILVPFAVALLFATRPYPRHVVYVLPPAIVLMAYASVQAARWARSAMPIRRAAVVCSVGAALLLAPTLVFDGRVLAHPATFHYPSTDYFQYVTGQPAGGSWPAVADTIRSRGTGRQVVILTPQAEPYVLQLLLSPDPRYRVVEGDSPLAPRAQFAINETGNPFVDTRAAAIVARDHFVLVRHYPRPGGGAVITLLERPR
jgi:4-amino-4-deoxy-L-arabinose transferase-like glycosyltransferase